MSTLGIVLLRPRILFDILSPEGIIVGEIETGVAPRLRDVLPRALLIFLAVGFLICASLALLYHLQQRDIVLSLLRSEAQIQALQRHSIQLKLRAVLSDLVFLRRQAELQEYLNGGNEDLRRAIAREYVALAESTGRYDQIRFIDDAGRECVRVNYRDNRAGAVPVHMLQDKSNRYYVSYTMRLGRGGIYISPFDLNIEHGEIERPFKPMIRFGTPVYDAEAKKRGIIVLNYLGQEIVEMLKQESRIRPGMTMLINRDGDWLYHERDADKEWAFMFPEGKTLSFARAFQGVWPSIDSDASAEVVRPEGAFVMRAIRPAFSASPEFGELVPTISMDRISATDRQWKLVTFISRETLRQRTRPLRRNMLWFGGLLLGLAAVVSLWLGEARARRKRDEAALQKLALYDDLTGLPNRTLFDDRLSQTLADAERSRSECSLLYLDLDGFKEVNDSLGHTAGDRLLKQVGERLTKHVRRSDTVARLGGDEFAILLRNTSGVKNACKVALLLLQVMAKPFSIKNHQVEVTASIGIAHYPDHGRGPGVLLRTADAAMYAAKQSGKNRYGIAGKDAMGQASLFDTSTWT